MQHARILKFLSIELVMPTNHLFYVAPFSSHPQSFPASGTFPMSQLFTSDGQSIEASASASASASNEYSGMISFRIDCLDVLAIQETLKCLLQDQNSKASILHNSTFLLVQLSYPYITNGKHHSLHYTDICWQSYVSAF